MGKPVEALRHVREFNQFWLNSPSILIDVLGGRGSIGKALLDLHGLKAAPPGCAHGHECVCLPRGLMTDSSLPVRVFLQCD